MDKKLIKQINTQLSYIFIKFQVTIHTQTVCKAILYKALTIIDDYEYKTLVVTCFLLSCKITDTNINVNDLEALIGAKFCAQLEIRLANVIHFTFDFFDAYKFVSEVCKTLKFDKSRKIEKLDEIFSDDRINLVGFINGPFAVEDVCMAVFDRKELELFENVYCYDLDYKKIEEVRNGLITQL